MLELKIYAVSNTNVNDILKICDYSIGYLKYLVLMAVPSVRWVTLILQYIWLYGEPSLDSLSIVSI